MTFEADQKITDAPLTECVRKLCRGKVQRQIPDSTSFSLKGSGWFKSGGY